jgi:hypothetical protein
MIQDDLQKPEIVKIKESGLKPNDIYGDLDSIELPDGVNFCWNDDANYACRLSAPGYLDGTDWQVFFTLDECIAHLVDMYYDYPETYPGNELRQYFIENFGIDEKTALRLIPD